VSTRRYSADEGLSLSQLEQRYDPDMYREKGGPEYAEEEGRCEECGEWFHRRVYNREPGTYSVTMRTCDDHGGRM